MIKFKPWQVQVFLTELRKLTAYRLDFWVNFLGQTFVALIIAYFLWVSIFNYAQTDLIKGHSIDYMIYYYLMVPLIFRIQQGPGIGFLSREIYDGGMNKYLLYPIDVFQYKAATYVANSVFFLMQLFIVLTLYHLFFYNPQIFTFSLINIFFFLISMTLAVFTFLYLFSISELMAFWFDNTWSLGVMLRFLVSFLGGALIPLAFFPDWAKKALMYTPFPYLIDFPMQCLSGQLPYYDILIYSLISLAWLFVFRSLCLFIWNKGQYQYTGVGI